MTTDMKTIQKPDDFDALSKEQQEIYDWLSNVKFKKRRFGGVDESDVWSKIGELNSLYEKLLIAERSKMGFEGEDADGGEDNDV